MRKNSVDSSGLPVLALGVCWVATLAVQSATSSKTIEAQIQQGIETQNSFKVQSVTCPKELWHFTQRSWECIGKLPSSETFAIEVSQNQQGRVQWEIPQSKVVLNLAQLEEHFQTTLKSQTGVLPTVHCGDFYRLNQPGDRFQCKVLRKNQSSLIVVTVDDARNVSWQEVLPDLASQPRSTTPSSTMAVSLTSLSPAISSK